MQKIHSRNFTFFPASYKISRRGKPLLCIGEYTYYTAKKRREGRVTWRCSTHNARGCKATVLTLKGAIINVNANHNHSVNISAVDQLLKSIIIMFRLLLSTTVPPDTLKGHFCGQLSFPIGIAPNSIEAPRGDKVFTMTIRKKGFLHIYDYFVAKKAVE